MSIWKDRLADIDDDYLIGLSNKGIVKRAYKDKGETAAAVQDVGEDVSVKVGEETVTVRYPLAESKCTCPSRSMCRHVVQAILVLKEKCMAEEADGSESAEEMPPAGQQERQSDLNVRPDQHAQPGQNEQSGQTVWKEIIACPFEKLKKTLGVRQFQSFVNQVAAGARPGISSSSVVTVQLPRQDYTVKLLAPLKYSTCSCHKKELCVHKASAILWCQLEAGSLTKEALLGEMEETQEYDMARVKEAAGQMKAFLEELFATGLSRTSPDVLDYLERLAVISHNEGLARFEGYFRALSDSYDRYFAGKAAFKTEDLMGQTARLYRRAELLQQAENAVGVAGLAGEFRADYIPVGNLDLIGIAMEHFESQTGYEGETVYFLEENAKKWYTYTNARPVFYDSRKRRGYAEKGQAPWGLNLSFENLLKVRIHLTGAKCDVRNRLSSSQETKGEVIGEQGLLFSDIKSWYYRNFDKMFSEQIGKQRKAWLAEQDDAGAAGGSGSTESGGNEARAASGKGVELVFVQPDSCAKAEFSQTGQQLTLPLYDKAGREILVEVVYSRQESGTIRYLERISGRKPPCFIGKIYLRDGRIRMYPVDLLELEEGIGTGETEAEGKISGGKQVGAGHTVNEPGNIGEGAEGRDRALPAEGTEGRDEVFYGADREEKDAVFSGRKSRYEAIEDLMAETASLMEDLYQSGFDTVHDSTLKDIRKAAEVTEQYGMTYLSQLLSAMAEQISLSRHRMERKTASMAELYTNVSEYLYLCRQKTAYDRGESYYI